jgi:hypothetical protein
VAISSDPGPHRLDYTLETRRGFATSRLQVITRGEGWNRRLDLRRTGSGGWSLAVRADGEATLPPPGGDPEGLAFALDCDLALSPLTNSMPILRHGLLQGGSPIELVVAWVSVPDLAVVSYRQRYTFVRHEGDRHIVRYEDIDGPFAAEIVFDSDGLVIDYPQIARRLDSA